MSSVKRRKVGGDVPAAVKESPKPASTVRSSAPSSPEPEAANSVAKKDAEEGQVTKTFKDLVCSSARHMWYCHLFLIGHYRLVMRRMRGAWLHSADTHSNRVDTAGFARSRSNRPGSNRQRKDCCVCAAYTPR